MAKGLRGLVGRLVGDSNAREIARLQTVVEEINALEQELQDLPDEQLRAKTVSFRRRLAGGETLDDLLPEAFAAMREAARRNVGLRHYDVQLIGGMVLHRRRIAEMKTGEGKTLVATLPLYLNALDLNPEWTERARERWGTDPERWEFVPLDGVPVGSGAHLVTVNDYLARRDGGWMGPAFHALGLTVGLAIPHFSAVYDPDYVEGEALLEDDRLVHWHPSTRQDAYRADVTYGTNNEFGFDYLRDNMVRDLANCVQRELNYAIVDEIDNVLIDEARTPLIISGPAEAPSDLYRRFSQLVRRLKPDDEYEVDLRSQVVTLTDEGISRVESQLPEIKSGEGLYDTKHAHMLPYLDNALHAYVIHKRDKDYIVKDGQVVIVDEFTGRLLHGRRYSEGLHQAIEAKEGLAVQQESLTYGTITVQNYFRMYHKLAGMTGTAATEREEFRTIYNLDVAVLPTNVEYRAQYGDLVELQRNVNELDVTFAGALNGQDNVTVTTYERGDGPEERYYRRLDFMDAIYKDEQRKFAAIGDEIEALRQAGRPVLVGTIAVETSEHLSALLKRRGIPHNVLNAKQHQQEALVIAQAGRPGAVTIATNMAGRGVDIVLGGEPAALAARSLQRSLEARLARAVAQTTNPDQDSEEEALSGEARQTALALSREYAAYERAKAEGGSALPMFFVERLIAQGELRREDRAEGVRLGRHVLAEAWQEAGKLTQESAAVSQQTITHLQRIREQFEQAGDAQQYVTSALSATYHNVLMALIRLVLADDVEAARTLLARYPELPREIVKTIEDVRDTCRRDQQRVCALGGLHVIGTERHDARRIDNQLRGRSARQGDPGSSRFYLSFEDDLMRRFGGERAKGIIDKWGDMGEVPLEFGLLSKTVESAQARVEGYNFDVRKHVLEYDDVVNKQREVIYEQRRQVLSEPNLRDQVLRMVQEEIEGLAASHCTGYGPEDWDLKGLHASLRTFLPLPPEANPEQWGNLAVDEIKSQLFDLAAILYDTLYRGIGHRFYKDAVLREDTLGTMRDRGDPLHRLIAQRVMAQLGTAPDAELLARPLSHLPEQEVEAGFVEAVGTDRDRQIMLRAVDGLWVRHLTDLAILREGIGLRAFGQQDPLVAFRKEAHDTYQQLLGQVQTQVARALFRAPAAAPAVRRQQLRAQRAGQPPARRAAGQTPSDATPRVPGGPKPGRNDPCWCGSGKKYKQCHMRQDQQAQAAPRASSRPPRAPRRRKRRR
jgi:preprotein translocase subunit SecA